MTTAIERTLTDYFTKEESVVRLAFLMGSFAKRTARPDSDVDVAALDLAAHVVASKRLGLPERSRESFALLMRAGIINAETATKMEKMTGFRNIAVHDYQTLDPEVLKSILVHRLKDLEDFYDTVLRFFGFPDR